MKFFVTFLFLSNISFATQQENKLTHQAFEENSTIDKVAENFLLTENKKKRTNWKSAGVNQKNLVSKCIVPLRAAWMSKDNHINYTWIAVVCDKTNADYEKKWEVGVKILPM